MAVLVQNLSMSWCWDSGRNHWSENGVPKNDTLLKFACITLITTACMQACVISSNAMSSYVADAVLWRLVVYLLLCIWAEPDKLVTQWRGRLFLNCCEETAPKKIFQDYVLGPRPLISLIIKGPCRDLNDLAHTKTTWIWHCTIYLGIMW